MLIGSTPALPRSLEDLIGPRLAARLDRIDVLSRKVFAGKLPGERRSKRRGQSVEFDDYRAYSPGDDLRHVDWNVFARLDRFFIKLFREEEDLSVRLLIDASPSMLAGGRPRNDPKATEDPCKLAYALRMAMALGYIGLVNQNRVSASVFGLPAERLRLAPLRGRRQIERLANFLVSVGESAAEVPPESAGTLSFVDQIRAVSGPSATGGPGVVILLSDMLYPDEIERGLNYATGGVASDGAVLQICSPGELEPESQSEAGVLGDLRLTDIESGKAAEVSVSGRLIRAYKERFKKHADRVHAAASARGLSHLVLNTREPVEDVILNALRRRRLVG